MSGVAERNSKTRDAAKVPVTDDPRFSVVHSDPRFAKPKRKDIKFAVDDRFKHMLREKDFADGPKVDRYGRKIEKNKGATEIRKFYRMDDDEEEPVYDPARGEGLLASGDEVSSDEELDAEIEEALENRELAEPFADECQIPLGDASRRFAVVNLDWDNVKSVDLLAVLQSFKPVNGKIIRVQIFPSEFGKDRMAQEDQQGPPREIFKDLKDEDYGSENTAEIEDKEITIKDLIEEGNDEEYDFQKLRKYQLERLRYYYAVVECDNEITAKHIYDACDGAEYENSANFFDIRFIPDDTEFSESEIRDQSSHLPQDYSPTEFVTDALQHTKVKLTWDNDDPQRVNITKKAFSQQEQADMDLRDYLASSDSDSDAIEREASKKRYRDLLDGINAPEEGEGDDNIEGEMEITFAPAFSENTSPPEKTLDTAENSKEETTLERYRRKEKERKMRKQKNRTEEVGETVNEEESKQVADLGFEDPFFNIDAKSSKTKQKKKDSKKHIEEDDIRRAELELIMMDENDSLKNNSAHFDMKAILKSEKQKRFKKRHGKAVTEGLQENFKIDVQDLRFTAVYQDPNYAIDPTNPRFKKTEAMDNILSERRRRMENMRDEDVTEERPKQKKHRKIMEMDVPKIGELKDLVNSIKAKSGIKKHRT
ncbi:Pre-rRNA-processing protein esf1 [Neolecta irregularis DAH-3]|uniref:Pre-rRNA-processing protein esf1 n=1 Tax=Neolecta irregularis (strain DAH-3) TaxID=1198029 RepID=A0A1U7LNV3_NEOID|nr:Pre-rRNA-processing protein esf1 [Neolecta irregularis DAH-3]|eukprot:OLL24346.1 Pre-rRNA-processing protein esf1 [Neolecta irregularis DAH-3]